MRRHRNYNIPKLDGEKWKVVDEYPDYFISNFGRAWSSIGLGRILKECKCGVYRGVFMRNNYNKRLLSIHRLVAKAFLPNPDNLPCINHKDCNPKNNRVDNLEWCTYQYNNDYDNRILKCKNVRPVYVYRYETNEFMGKYESFSEAGRHLNCRRNTISEVVSGKHKHHHGYIFTLKPLERNS